MKIIVTLLALAGLVFVVVSGDKIYEVRKNFPTRYWSVCIATTVIQAALIYVVWQ